jgi:hypothetical protein
VIRTPSLAPAERLVGGGLAVTLAGAAAVAGDARQALERDLAGLSWLERAAVALWDLPPTGMALAAAGIAIAAVALARHPAPWSPRVEAWAHGTAGLAAAGAGFCAVVLGLCAWVVSTGAVESGDGIRFEFTTGDRVATLVIQVVGYVPAAVVFVAGIRVATWPGGEGEASAARPGTGRSLEAPPAAAAPRLGEQPASTDIDFDAAPTPGPTLRAERLWRERLAFSPSPGPAREILEELRRRAASGDDEGAARLLDELERLAGRGEA